MHAERPNVEQDPSSRSNDQRRHGRSLYANGGCRCEVCREAHRRYQAEWKRRAVARTQTTGQLPEAVEHGSVNAFYNHGCRCRACLDAAALAARERKARMREVGIPATARHGVETTYVNLGCRCDACREARRVADRRRRTSRPSAGDGRRASA